MSTSGFDASDLSDLENQLLRLAAKQYPKEAKSFLRTQGNKAKTRLRNRTKSVTKKKTGNILRGIDKSAPKLYEGSFQIRVYNKAPHAHLIEHGHVMADKYGKPILNTMGQEMWVNGRFPAAQTTNELKAIWPGEVEQFIDELLEKGVGLMITIIDTIRAVSDLMEQIFDEAPTSKDITQGFDRPCTYVQPTGIETERSGGLRHDTYSLQIIRFAERSYLGYQDLLEYQIELTDALENPIPVSESFVLYPENVSFSLRRDEMVLLCEFSVQNIQALQEEDADAETMETLNLRRKE